MLRPTAARRGREPPRSRGSGDRKSGTAKGEIGAPWERTASVPAQKKSHNCLSIMALRSEADGARTHDLRIKSPLLYRLSYSPSEEDSSCLFVRLPPALDVLPVERAIWRRIPENSATASRCAARTSHVFAETRAASRALACLGARRPRPGGPTGRPEAARLPGRDSAATPGENTPGPTPGCPIPGRPAPCAWPR